MSNESHLARHFETYRQEILSFLRSRVANPDLADDLLQQTFLRLLQRANWATVDNPKAYLKATAKNVLSDYYSLQSVRFSDTNIEYREARHSDDTWGPGRLLQSRQQLAQVTAALERLSTSVRRAFILSRIFGHTHAKVGEMLDISPRTVEKHVAKGLATCFAAVSDAYPGDNAKAEASNRNGQ